MRVCIHRGAQQIGGTCIEIEAQGQRIVLDVGLPLDAAPGEVELPAVRGFDAPDPSLLGVVLSHPHQDHVGLADRLPAGTRVLIGAAAQRLLAAARDFCPAGLALDRTLALEHRVPIRLGPFTLTPTLVDHSGYDAYALLVEADGKRLFYSGDLRAHGRKAKLFEQLVRDPPANVDVLLMEGTTVGRGDAEAPFPTEDALEARFVEIFRRTAGMPLVFCAGQNIDRIVSVFRACKKTGRQLIVDLYVAQLLRATENPRIPQAHWQQVRVFLPSFQKRQIVRQRAFEAAARYRRARIFPEALRTAAPRSVLLFRPSMIGDLDAADCLAGAKLVYSMWSGYLEREAMQPLLGWLDRRGIPMETVHTSGHASVADLKRLRAAFAGAVVVPVHTACAERFGMHFEKVVQLRDRRPWTLRNGAQNEGAANGEWQSDRK